MFGLWGTRPALCAAILMLIWASAQGQEMADSLAGTLSWEYAEEPSGVDVFFWLGEHMTPELEQEYPEFSAAIFAEIRDMLGLPSVR